MSEKNASKRRSITEFLFGHEKLNLADAAEILIGAIITAYIIFYILKIEEII